jgi:hypothetical protein
LVLQVVQRFWRKKYGVELFYSLTRPSYVLPRQLTFNLKRTRLLGRQPLYAMT